MVAQPTSPTSTVSPAVNALRRFFLEHGQALPTERAEEIHGIIVGSLLAQLLRDTPDWRFRNIAPGSAQDVAWRRLARAWYERGAHLRREASILQKDGRGRLQAWFDAGCPWPQF